LTKNNMMRVTVSRTAKTYIKQLHKNQKKDLDLAIQDIISNPYLGQAKKGDLSDIRVYKFRMIKQLTLLAYKLIEEDLLLIVLTIGSHENSYRDLKK